ncbi:MAG: hypothetical protein ACK5KL_16710 [Dysgonomonas sp.]
MSQYEQDILNGIRALGSQEANSFIAVVENNYPDKDYVDVKDLASTQYLKVRKRAAIESGTDGIIITPVTGSTVIVTRIGKSDELYISMFSEVDTISMVLNEIEIRANSIQLNNGTNGGLVLSQQLTLELNKVITRCNAITTALTVIATTFNAQGTVPLTGVSAGSIVQSAIAALSNPLLFPDKIVFENEKVKH